MRRILVKILMRVFRLIVMNQNTRMRLVSRLMLYKVNGKARACGTYAVTKFLKTRLSMRSIVKSFMKIPGIKLYPTSTSGTCLGLPKSLS